MFFAKGLILIYSIDSGLGFAYNIKLEGMKWGWINIYWRFQMQGENKTLEKLITIEKTINDLVEMRHQIIELKASEAQRQMALVALQSSESKYRTLAENIPQKLFIKDKNSVYVSCNQNYAQDLKIEADQIVGKTDYDFFPREKAEKYIADDKRIMEKGKPEDIE